jgi:hypothetical protein
LTDGWKGSRKGLWQSFIDIETATPALGWLKREPRRPAWRRFLNQWRH